MKPSLLVTVPLVLALLLGTAPAAAVPRQEEA